MKAALPVGLVLTLSLGATGCAHFQADDADRHQASVAEKAAQRGLPFDISRDIGLAPYGDEMTRAVGNYNRPAPFIGTGGQLADGAMAELKGMGFKTVVSLLNPREGLEAEREAAHDAGLNFYSISVSSKAPTEEQVREFAGIVSATGNYPILVHCASSNRVGAMWALYRHQMGVPAEIALEEGKAAGLKTSREPAVRERLGLAGSQ
ncbi:sulfur transferase domain-containing protein [uncultured Halovibrio sp.]|uniref:fused DSP-PTPase phosphatase/NAD kinase-like protein n=1 Tax=uncultured Halovibrio sp. TaxID=985049 RepID=UPI00260034EE|nr:sulfur transferase domain-containing protein [uncultured Halovibrio sp.]